MARPAAFACKRFRPCWSLGHSGAGGKLHCFQLIPPGVGWGFANVAQFATRCFGRWAVGTLLVHEIESGAGERQIRVRKMQSRHRDGRCLDLVTRGGEKEAQTLPVWQAPTEGELAFKPSLSPYLSQQRPTRPKATTA